MEEYHLDPVPMILATNLYMEVPKWAPVLEAISVEHKLQDQAHTIQFISQEEALQFQAIEANHACRIFQDQEPIILTNLTRVDLAVRSKISIKFSIGRAQRSEMTKLETPGPGQYYHHDGQ